MTASTNLDVSSSVESLSPRILELRAKIQNPEYLDFAIQRIAQVLSRKIVEDNSQSSLRGEYEPK